MKSKNQNLPATNLPSECNGDDGKGPPSPGQKRKDKRAVVREIKNIVIEFDEFLKNMWPRIHNVEEETEWAWPAPLPAKPEPGNLNPESFPIASTVGSSVRNKKYDWVTIDSRFTFALPTKLAQTLLILAEDASRASPTDAPTDPLIPFKSPEDLIKSCDQRGCHCSHHGLAVRISRLRQWLRGTSVDPRVIETSPGGNYRVRIRRILPEARRLDRRKILPAPQSIRSLRFES